MEKSIFQERSEETVAIEINTKITAILGGDRQADRSDASDRTKSEYEVPII